MKILTCVIVLICILSGVVYSQSEVTIEYVDLDGNIRQVPASADGRIIVFRADGSPEVDLIYKQSLLERVSVRRGDGSAVADMLYGSNGQLQSVTARRRDGSAEAHIVYREETLSDIASFRADGKLEAIVGYEDGVLEHLSIADPDRKQVKNEQRQTIEFFPVAQLRVTGEMVLCEAQ